MTDPMNGSLQSLWVWFPGKLKMTIWVSCFQGVTFLGQIWICLCLQCFWWANLKWQEMVTSAIKESWRAWKNDTTMSQVFPSGRSDLEDLRIQLLKVKYWEKTGYFLVLDWSCIKRPKTSNHLFYLKILAPIFWSSKIVIFSEGLHDLGYDYNNIMQ